jgi:NTP pyrophosphatase (non-canonical NTP hydrolase)
MFAIGSLRWPGLSKVAEESGEVVQVIGKLMGTGGEPAHWDGSDLRVRLQEELGDLLAAVDYVLRVNPYALNELEVAVRRSQKLETFLRWHRQQGGPDAG